MKDMYVTSEFPEECVQALDDRRVRSAAAFAIKVMGAARAYRACLDVGETFEVLPELREWYEWAAQTQGNWCWIMEFLEFCFHETKHRTGNNHLQLRVLEQYMRVRMPDGAYTGWPGVASYVEERAALAAAWVEDKQCGLKPRWSGRGQPDWYNKFVRFPAKEI